jgi:HPt (histidine-containing phosphotransfer) domain-containing protein
MGDERGTLDVGTLADLRDSVGGDSEFLAELIDELLADAPGQLATLRDAATSGDAEAARRAAHTLKGNGRTFGATALASLCQEAEAAATNGDIDAVLARVDEIAAEWERARAELVAWRNGGGARDGA